MTASIVLAWSVVRTLLVATVAVSTAQLVLHRGIPAGRPLLRRILPAALLVPLTIPELIVGFSWRYPAQFLTHSPAATEILYAGVLLIRSCAVALLVFLMMPQSAVTPESLHSWALLPDRTVRHRMTALRLNLTGPWRAFAVAWCLTALVSFQDFETAALIQIDRHPVAWTAWLFDAHAGGQQPSETLKRLAGPLTVQMALLIPAVLLIATVPERETESPAIRQTGERHLVCAVAACLFALTGLALTGLWPLAVMVPEAIRGLPLILRDGWGLAASQMATLGFSAAAAATALSAAFLLKRHGRLLWVILLLLPGLTGSLAVSLGLLRLFQLPGLRILWDTWLPLLLGQSLLMLPRAWVLLQILDRLVPVESVHSARLLKTDARFVPQARRLLWRLQELGWLAAVALLCHWCLWDVTTASILRPVSVEPVVTRLYREMHFSRTESLSALTLITMLMPAAAAGAGIAVRMLADRCGRWMPASGTPSSRSEAVG